MRYEQYKGQNIRFRFVAVHLICHFDDIANIGYDKE